jgi:hypothetical protein
VRQREIAVQVGRPNTDNAFAPSVYGPVRREAESDWLPWICTAVAARQQVGRRRPRAFLSSRGTRALISPTGLAAHPLSAGCVASRATVRAGTE